MINIGISSVDSGKWPSRNCCHEHVLYWKAVRLLRHGQHAMHAMSALPTHGLDRWLSLG